MTTPAASWTEFRGHDRLRARIAELDDAGVRVSGRQSFGGRLFHLKRMTGDNNRKPHIRDGTSAERLLLDSEEPR